MADEQSKYHGARIHLRRQLLHDLLGLPADVHVRAVYEDARMGDVCLHIEGERLPEVEDGAMPPMAQGETYMDTDGRLRVRFTLPESGSDVAC